MRTAVRVTLIICGTLCFLTPWAYAGLRTIAIAWLLHAPGAQRITLENPVGGFQFLLTIVLGVILVMLGISGAREPHE
jgi:hypothetical protein